MEKNEGDLKKTLIVVDDHTRHTPIFESLWGDDIIVATGSHVPFNEQQRIGRPVVEHSQKDVIGYEDFFINEKVFDYDSLLLVGSIFPHATVGWSGGAKTLIPGLAGIQTIEKTHWKALEWTMENEDRMESILGNWNNPVRSEIERMVKSLPMEINILNFILSPPDHPGVYPLRFGIYDWVYGELQKAHLQGIEKSKRVWGVIKERGNIVRAEVWNSSFTFRQSIKGICSADIVCNDGGYIILDTWSSMIAPQFQDSFEKEGFGKPEETYEKAITGKISKLVAYTLVTIGRIAKRKKIIIVNPNMEEEAVKRLGFFGYTKTFKEAKEIAQSDFKEKHIHLENAGLIRPIILS